MAEHFVQPPHWEWYITFYFYLAGLAGGSYTLATMLRLWGSPNDAPVARIAYRWALPLIIVCAILLTIDLGQPLRFWHMLINTTPNNVGLNFKYWSPISIGTWAVLIFGIFSLLAFLDSLGERLRLPVAVSVAGSLVALFITAYTGVVLSVSNQPVWSDSWAIGGLFVASALSGSAALLLWISARLGSEVTELRLREAEGYFALLELVMIAIFFATLASAGTLGRTLGMPWLLVWLLAIASTIPSIAEILSQRRGVVASTAGTVAITATRAAVVTPIIGLVGVLLLRIAVIFSAQF